MKEKITKFVQSNITILSYLILFPIVLIIADFSSGKEIKLFKYVLVDFYIIIGAVVFGGLYWVINKITKKPILSAIITLVLGAIILGLTMDKFPKI